MTTANVGPGVLAKMEELGDHPITPSIYKHYSKDGVLLPTSSPVTKGFTVEETRGTLGLYVASNMSGQWEIAGPFGSSPGVAPGIQREVIWKGSPNFYEGHPFGVIAIVIHTMGGTLEGADSWFSQTRSQVSSHYGVGLDGEIHQYVKLSDSAWANGIRESGHKWPGASVNPNHQTISIETEDLNSADTPVTQEMYESVEQCCRSAMGAYPSIEYLMAHRAISPRSRSGCPGNRWLTTGKFLTLASKLGLEPIT